MAVSIGDIETTAKREASAIKKSSADRMALLLREKAVGRNKRQQYAEARALNDMADVFTTEGWNFG